jgi:hypothetical protein
MIVSTSSDERLPLVRSRAEGLDDTASDWALTYG